MLLAGLFMAALDVAIVNAAAPQIRKGLHVSSSELVLVVSGYTLAYAMLLITGARLGNDQGHRRLFIVGLAGFTLASLTCGFAPNGSVLIAARVVQGGFAAMLVPQVISVIQIQFDGAERARALGLYAMVLSFGAVSGQVIGGALVSANLFGTSWRPVFLVNVPVGLVLLAAAPRLLAPSRGPSRRLDLPGVGLLSATVLLLVLPMILGQTEHWPAWTFVALIAGALLLAVTIVYLRRESLRGHDPVLNLAVFASPGMGLGLGSIAASFVAYGGFLFGLALLLQAGLGFGALHSGLIFVPFAAGFAVSSLGSPKLPAGIQCWASPAGLACMAAGYAALGYASRSGTWHFWPAAVVLALTGSGFGAGFSPVIAAALSRVPLDRAHDASGLVNTTVQVGYMVGVVTLGSYFLSATHTGNARSSGVAFATVSICLAAFALVAAVLAARLSISNSKTRRPFIVEPAPATAEIE